MPATNEITTTARALIEAIERYTAAVTATPLDQDAVEPVGQELEHAAAAYDDAVFDATGLVTPFVVLEGPSDDDFEGDLDGGELPFGDGGEPDADGTAEVVTLQARYDFLVTDPEAVIALANERQVAGGLDEPDEPAGDLPSAVLRLYRADNGWDAAAYDQHGLTAVEERVICGPFADLELAQELLFGDDDEDDLGNDNGNGTRPSS